MDDARPLTDAELDRLDQALARRPKELGDISLSAADGFICAAAISPEFIAPREWMAALFGEADAGAFADKGEAAEIHALAWRRPNAILASLAATPPTFEPLLEFDNDGWPLGEVWAEGFHEGMGLRWDSWAPILDNASCETLVLPVLALADPKILAELEPRKAKRADLASRLTASLKLSIAGLSRMTAALRDGRALDSVELDAGMLAALSGPLQASSKPATVAQIGRNDPCPCGSGQKYKRCCGAAA